ncbi:MAG TPA: lysoplasmalogenase [Desulfatiglandales bacterium]|nr:lysoplasmalogenase [Desulfatiglandales bacterium]
MLNVLIIILAAIFLFGVLFFEKRENRRGLLPAKTVLSLLFILAVLVQPHPIPSYFYLLLAGLIVCMGGDVFLALPQGKMFLFGLVSFLLGHLCYILAFFSVAGTSTWTWIGLLTVLVMSAWIYAWLRPHLGSMNIPVLVYVIIISIMVSGAWTVLGDLDLTRSGRIMVFIGALSFYFSDVFVARDRFIGQQFLNRLLGLPLYYAGQFLLAFSVGLLG